MCRSTARWRISTNNPVRRFCFPVLLCLSLISASGRAQEAAKNVRWIDSVAIDFFISSGYSYNVNDPASGKNLYHVFDVDDNTFKVDVLELAIRRDAAGTGDAGFRIDLTAGSEVPRVTQSSGLTFGDLDFHQMYLSYVAPGGIRIDLGKFVTAMGYEVIDGYDGYNDNYTRSFLFGYAIPFTHTGIRASGKFNDVFSALLMVVNGWDNAVDNNMSKSVCEQLTVTPGSGASIALTHMWGPEKAGNDADYRNSFDVAGAWTAVEALTIGFNGDYSAEDHSAPGNGTGRWYGTAGYLRIVPAPGLSVNLRAEQFEDRQGLRTGVAQKLREVTVTPAYQLSPHVVVRGDYRIDTSDKRVFERDNGWSDRQTTISVDVVAVF